MRCVQITSSTLSCRLRRTPSEKVPTLKTAAMFDSFSGFEATFLGWAGIEFLDCKRCREVFGRLRARTLPWRGYGVVVWEP